MNKTALYTTAMIVPMIAGIALPHRALAQDTAQRSSASAVQLEEVVVMARRVSENLQTVPISVTALTANDINKYGLRSFSDLTLLTPSVNIQNHSAAGFFSSQSIVRGVFNPLLQLSIAPPIALYVDGVFAPSTFGLVAGSFYDVDRVEVLKGPQGTLFGQSTTAGAIAVYHKLPIDTFEGELGAGFGNYGELTGKGMVNIPIVQGKVALRVAGDYIKDDGYGRDTGSDRPLADADIYTVRGVLKLNPNEKLQILLGGHTSKGKSGGSVGKTGYIAPGSLAARVTALYLFGSDALSPARIGTTLPATQAIIDDHIKNDGLYNVQFNPAALYGPLSSHFEKTGVSATIDYDLGFAHLKSIAAYDDWSISGSYNGGDIALVQSIYVPIKAKQYSEELQLIGGVFDDHLKYTVGAYYFHLTGDDFLFNQAVPALNPAAPAINSTHARVSNYAAYGQGTFALTDRINLTAGARLTSVKKDLVDGNTNATGCLVAVAFRSNGQCFAELSTSETKPSWTAGVDWTVVPNVMLYGKVSGGYTAGGPPQRVNLDPNSYRSYNPETVTSYEVGAKADFLDRRLRTNLAAYYSDYSNIQRQVNVIIPVPGGGSQVSAILTNAARATMKGVEAEITALPFEHANISLIGGYTEPRYKEYFDRGLDVSYQRFPLLSKWTYAVSGGYEVPTAIGPLSGQLTWAWRSSLDLQPAETPGLPSGTGSAIGSGVPDTIRIQRAYGVLNGTIRLAIDKYDAEILLTGTNLLQKTYFTGGSGAVNAGVGWFQEVPGDPRRWRVEFLKRF